MIYTKTTYATIGTLPLNGIELAGIVAPHVTVLWATESLISVACDDVAEAKEIIRDAYNRHIVRGK